MAAFLNAVYQTPTLELARSLASQFAATYEGPLPLGGAQLPRRSRSLSGAPALSDAHRRAIRTTNIIERAFEELRRRTKAIPKFFDAKSCLKLAYAELVRAGQRSRRVRMIEIELRQLQLLRRELIDEHGTAPPSRRQAKIA